MKNTYLAILASLALVFGGAQVAIAKDGGQGSGSHGEAPESAEVGHGGGADDRGGMPEVRFTGSTTVVDDEGVDLDEDMDDEHATGTEANDDHGEGHGRGEDHRSNVANFVQALIASSENEGDRGEKIREFAREQASSSDRVADAAEAVEHRGKWKTFFLGTDYKNLGTIRSEVVQTRNRIERLNRVVEAMGSSTQRGEIETQIGALEEEQTKLEDFVTSHEDTFSLFGWVAKMFQ